MYAYSYGPVSMQFNGPHPCEVLIGIGKTTGEFAAL